MPFHLLRGSDAHLPALDPLLEGRAEAVEGVEARGAVLGGRVGERFEEDVAADGAEEGVGIEEAAGVAKGVDGDRARRGAL